MRRAILFFFALTLVACGDDDGSDSGRDTGSIAETGPIDGGRDTSGSDAGGSDDTGAGDTARGDTATGDTGSDAGAGDAGSDSGGPACRPGTSCGATRFCDYTGDTCGGDATDGMCSTRPTACPEDCPGVCGCDGHAYCNSCVAAQAGFDVNVDAECEVVEDPCARMDARDSGVCDREVGYAYDGTRCVTINCACVGSDCGRLYPTSTACEAATLGCGGSGTTCGGFGGSRCPSGEFCSYERDDICGAADASGTCETRPSECPGLGFSVCGCDGASYPSECSANMNGTSVAIDGACDS